MKSLIYLLFIISGLYLFFLLTKVVYYVMVKKIPLAKVNMLYEEQGILWKTN